MKAGIVTFIAGYVLSQFYRAFLPVLTPVLEADLGATPEGLGRASGVWFLAFAAMQIPVGWALDRFGPRRVAASLFSAAAAGAAVFALATAPVHILWAMALMGIGCSPVLMSSYYIIARAFPAHLFGSLAGLVLGLGSLGNIAGSLPMAWAAEAFGWRATLWGLALITLAISALILAVVRDPPRPEPSGETKGSLITLLTIPALWAIFPMMFVNYAPSAGLRGAWTGPFLRDVYGLGADGIGMVTLAMGLAMVIGSLAYGPLDRILGTRKWVVFTGNAASAVAILALWAWPTSGVVAVTALVAAAGFFGASYPQIMAHGRAYFPAHLTGRGVTLLNLLGISGVGLFQFSSAWVYESATLPGDPVAGYRAVFLFFAVPVLIGSFVYLFSRDRVD
ncbi:MAG: MFS transporter [Rhodobacterales bacterium]|nr:MAG: MFS transporter [Rhodobacterales bacterium]